MHNMVRHSLCPETGQGKTYKDRIFVLTRKIELHHLTGEKQAAVRRLESFEEIFLHNFPAGHVDQK